MPHPTDVTADKKHKLLTIAWDDGVSTAYPFQFLADNCRCATCNAERNELAAQGKPFVGKSDDLLTLEPVGSYAISIVWQGGCRFGIFTWDYLAQLRERVRASPAS